MNIQEQNKINELLFRLLDNEISDSDLVWLNDRLISDPRARVYYCHFMEDTGALSLRGSTSAEEVRSGVENDILGDHFWQQMGEEEKNAPALEVIPDTVPEAEMAAPVIPRKPVVRPINKFSLAAAVFSAAALIFIIAMVHLAPSLPYEAATVLDSVNAQWSGGQSLEPGMRITTHSRPLRLLGGVVKLVTDEHVELVLEGPTEFHFVSYSEIALNYGKLFARVSPQGVGFSVATANSRIVDLGTEFAVVCQINGDTEVHVYKGRANLFAGQKSEHKISETLTAGTARKVRYENSGVQEIALEEKAVVREIDSKAEMVWRGQSLSLADVVGGGSGFGGAALHAGIDTVTGRGIDRLESIETRFAEGGYKPVASTPFVDGVFVPGAEPGQTQITSGGMTTQAFAKTSGALWGYIFNGAFHEGTTTPRHGLRLEGMAFGTKDRPAIAIHSNQGITFDLDRIRAAIPGLSIRSFETLIGVSETVGQSLRQEQGRSFDDFPAVKKVFDAQCAKVEFWVFVDGRRVFHEVRSSADGTGRVHIDLAQQDRFLTVAVTESDDTQAYDWALLGRPELTLESAEK